MIVRQSKFIDRLRVPQGKELKTNQMQVIKSVYAFLLSLLKGLDQHRHRRDKNDNEALNRREELDVPMTALHLIVSSQSLRCCRTLDAKLDTRQQ